MTRNKDSMIDIAPARCYPLPEDNVVDPVAVAVAVAGTRPVGLTPTEQGLVARRLFAAGEATSAISHRLRMSAVKVLALRQAAPVDAAAAA